MLDLTNQFLIAMPNLADPNFSRTVTYVCAHSDEGAMGIVINRPTELQLGEVLTQMDLAAKGEEVANMVVFQGGPVHPDRGFIIHRPCTDWGSTFQVAANIGVSTSREILAAIARGAGPDDILIALGYAGWGAGQLEGEMAQNAWLSGPADPEIIFSEAPDDRWEKAARALGIDLTLLSPDIGHA